jgi:hypothetical protein
MAQHDYVIANGTGAAVRSDLNNALAAIVSQNSGATEPATTYAYQWWADTTTNLLKLRNSANSGWITLFQLDGEWSTIALENGTAGAPSLYFKDSGTDTGFYSPGANQVGISTGGTARLTIDSNGNVDIDSNTLYVDAANNRVGLGTSSPGYRLDVRGPAEGSVNIQGGTAYGQLALTDGGSGVNYIDSTNTNLSIRTNTSSWLRLGTNNTTAVHIDSSQRVGIGTTTPQVFSGYTTVTIDNATNGGVLCINKNAVNIGNISGTNDALTLDGAGAGSSPIVFRTGAATTERARIDTSGRLLVGTSSAPTVGDAQYANLVLRGYAGGATGDSFLALLRGQAPSSIASGAGLGSIVFGASDGSPYATITGNTDGTGGSGDYPGRLVFSTTADGASSPTERMRITNGGAFKATTTGSYSLPSSKIHELRSDLNDRSLWVSNTHNTSPAGIYVKYEGADPNNTGNEFLVCDGNTTIRATIRSNGGIANFSANNVNLSDRNVKKDITPAAGTWDCLKEWEIVNFRYKDQPDDADLNMGVIAQQVAESCPEVITVFQEATEDQPEKLGVKDQQMMWMAIKALQEAQLRIETLEAEVAALKGA